MRRLRLFNVLWLLVLYAGLPAMQLVEAQERQALLDKVHSTDPFQRLDAVDTVSATPSLVERVPEVLCLLNDPEPLIRRDVSRMWKYQISWVSVHQESAQELSKCLEAALVSASPEEKQKIIKLLKSSVFRSFGSSALFPDEASTFSPDLMDLMRQQRRFPPFREVQTALLRAAQHCPVHLKSALALKFLLDIFSNIKPESLSTLGVEPLDMLRLIANRLQASETSGSTGEMSQGEKAQLIGLLRSLFEVDCARAGSRFCFDDLLKNAGADKAKLEAVRPLISEARFKGAR